MASRPGIRTLNSGYNTVGRPTSPANYRGGGVRQISPTLASQQARTEILATGRKNQTARQPSPASAALAAGTVFTQQISQAMQTTQKGFSDLLSQLPLKIPVINTPLGEIAGINKPIAEIPGINKPLISNPVQAVGGFIQTSQYTPELMQEARVRAQKGDVVSGLYVLTGDTVVKGADSVYQYYKDKGVQGNALTPMKTLANLPQIASGALVAGAGLISSVPAALQTANFMANPQKMAYTGELPQKVSGVAVANARPAISDTMTVSVDSVEQAGTVLGNLTTSAGELARQELPRVVEAVATEFRENPYGLAGQILGGAVLAKGIGRVAGGRKPAGVKVEGKPAASTQKRSTPDKQKYPTKEDAMPWVEADYTIKASRVGTSPSRGGMRPSQRVLSRDATGFADLTRTQKQAVLTSGAGATAAYAAANADVVDIRDVPQRVMTISFTSGNGLVDDVLKDYPTRDKPSTAQDSTEQNKNKSGGGFGNAGGTLIVNPVKDANITRVTPALLGAELVPRIEYVRVREIADGESRIRNRDENKERYAEGTRVQNRVRDEFGFEYPRPTSVRTGRKSRRKVDIDIDIPRVTAKPKQKRRKKRYAKRQIVNPLPWLWDEDAAFSRKLPKEVLPVSAESLSL